MEKQRRGLDRYNVLHDSLEIPGLSNNTTENLKQKKIISWAPVDQATDESSGPNHRKWIALGRGHNEV